MLLKFRSYFVSGILPSGDIAALVYLWNPFTIVACVGLSTSPVENMAILLALYGACKGIFLPSLRYGDCVEYVFAEFITPMFCLIKYLQFLLMLELKHIVVEDLRLMLMA